MAHIRSISGKPFRGTTQEPLTLEVEGWGLGFRGLGFRV